MSEVFEGHVVPSIGIENLLRQRDAVLTMIDQALNILTEAKALAAAAHIGFPRIRLETSRYTLYTMLDKDRIAETRATMMQEVDSEAWQYLMNESGLRTFMDADARRKWDESLHKGKAPELTIDTLKATFTNLYLARSDMFERGVIAVFRRLSWDYKTNKPFAFGRRVILQRIRGSVTGNGNSLGYVSNSNTDELDDLTRVLSVLDGKPEPDHREGWHSRLNQVRTTADRHAETRYMQVKCFRNGNAHLLFKRMDLVEKMNQILAKHYPGALPFDHHEREAA